MPINNNEKGFGLLELMVAIFVLAIGLLGLAHLQTTTLKHNESAYLRSQASTLASDILDRMRANQVSAQAGNYNFSISDKPPESASTVADLDVSEWLSNLSAFLPQGVGSISCDDSNTGDALACSFGSIYTITVQWSEVQSDGARGTTSFNYTGAL